MAHTRIARYEELPARPVKTVVSLHCHTQHSREVLELLPGWMSSTPLTQIRRQRDAGGAARRSHPMASFPRAHWRPPAAPRDVFESEREQIERRFQASALVSITDHDTIAANLGLRDEGFANACPISVEWTVPFRGSVFHLGVHNMPVDVCNTWMREFEAFTEAPAEPALEEILAGVHGSPSTLIVLNHPFWDAQTDRDQDEAALAQFVGAYRPYLDAVEINGYRGYPENLAALALGRGMNAPVLAGGDRHGRQANALLNLTNAASFDEFVAEVRQGRLADLVMMPEYQERPTTIAMAAVAEALHTVNGMIDVSEASELVVAPHLWHASRMPVVEKEGRLQ